MGSEMCIRDSSATKRAASLPPADRAPELHPRTIGWAGRGPRCCIRKTEKDSGTDSQTFDCAVETGGRGVAFPAPSRRAYR